MRAVGSRTMEALRQPGDWESLRAGWNEIVARQSSGIEDLDVTASFDWAITLWETHLQRGEMEVLTLREADEIMAVLPLYRFRRTIRRIPCRAVAPVTELYSGRIGFLLREPGTDLLESLLEHMRRRISDWDITNLSLVRDSTHEKLFLEYARRHGLRTKVLEENFSPYIPLQDSWNRHFSSLPKKLRSTIRNGEKRLRERGELSYRECRTPEEAAEFNSAVREIEQDSWKEASGTSIASNPIHASFHSSMTLRAAQNGWFSGHLLLLDGEAIAYVMGLLYNGIFLDLKESYCNSFREMSPGHVLKNFLFAKLYEQNARVYDFMGKCEEYKMKWTDKTYCRRTYLLFNKTLRGEAARWLSTLWDPSFGETAPTNTAKLKLACEAEARRATDSEKGNTVNDATGV